MSRNFKKPLICLSLIGVLLFSSLKPVYASNFNVSYVRNLSEQSTIIAFDDGFDIDIGEWFQGFSDFFEKVFNPENPVPDPSSVTLPEENPEITPNSHFEEPKFGDESGEIQQDENSLPIAKSQVDNDRLLIKREQDQINYAESRIKQLSDQIKSEANQSTAYEYQSEMSSLETELTNRQQKLEQARTDLATHQQEEYRLENKIREAINKKS